MAHSFPDVEPRVSHVMLRLVGGLDIDRESSLERLRLSLTCSGCLVSKATAAAKRGSTPEVPHSADRWARDQRPVTMTGSQPRCINEMTPGSDLRTTRLHRSRSRFFHPL